MKDFKVRFVPSFVVITLLWSSPPQIHMHCFSNAPDFAARLFTHFPNFTSDPRYGTHSFLPFPSHPVSTGVITYSTTYLLVPNVLCLPLLLLYAAGILERYEELRCRMEMIPWTVEFATTMARRGGMLTVMILGGECARFDVVVLDVYKECPALDQEDRGRYP